MPVWYVIGNNTHFCIKWGKNERQKNYKDQKIYTERVSEPPQTKRDGKDHDLGYCKRSGYRQKDFKGTEKITISDIAREADIDRKTFYLHYDSTEDIIREYAEEKTRELLTRLTIRSFFSLSFDRKIFAKEVNSMLAEHLEFCRMRFTQGTRGSLRAT